MTRGLISSSPDKGFTRNCPPGWNSQKGSMESCPNTRTGLSCAATKSIHSCPIPLSYPCTEMGFDCGFRVFVDGTYVCGAHPTYPEGYDAFLRVTLDVWVCQKMVEIQQDGMPLVRCGNCAHNEGYKHDRSGKTIFRNCTAGAVIMLSTVSRGITINLSKCKHERAKKKYVRERKIVEYIKDDAT